jgi:acyl-CoA reductase-like NAD-dependent aldehyde dehydrogenase
LQPDGTSLFGIHRGHFQRGDRIVCARLTGETIAGVSEAVADGVTGAIERSKMAFLAWRSFPAPRRELVRIL